MRFFVEKLPKECADCDLFLKAIFQNHSEMYYQYTCALGAKPGEDCPLEQIEIVPDNSPPTLKNCPICRSGSAPTVFKSSLGLYHASCEHIFGGCGIRTEGKRSAKDAIDHWNNLERR